MKKLILLSLVLLACSKEKADKGPYYDQFVGTWSSVGSSEREEIVVKPNGVIVQSFELERRKRLVVTKWNGPDTSNIAGNSWVNVGFRGKYETGIRLYIDFTGDTLITAGSAPNIIDGVLIIPEKYKRFVKIK